ncbi:hypothetical protein GcM3_222006, partial [Golovinomyces cichoracearum]
MYTNPRNVSQKINLLLRGHPERFRIETRLTIIQFERLAVWLYENTTPRESRLLTLKAKLAIFLYIVGHGATYRNASIHWELNIER